jgi:hypothetical protein
VLQIGAREAGRRRARREIRDRLDDRVVVCQNGRVDQQVTGRPDEPPLPFLKRVQLGKGRPLHSQLRHDRQPAHVGCSGPADGCCG